MSEYLNAVLGVKHPEGSLAERIAMSLGAAVREANSRPSHAESTFRRLVEGGQTVEAATETMKTCPHPGRLWDDDDDDLDGRTHALCRTCGFAFIVGGYNGGDFKARDYAQEHWGNHVDRIAAAYLHSSAG